MKLPYWLGTRRELNKVLELLPRLCWFFIRSVALVIILVVIVALAGMTPG
jgi:hypothetical protein